jgi:hypothetical protein
MNGTTHPAVQRAATFRRKIERLLGVVPLCSLLACEPDLVVGKWDCRASSGDEGAHTTTEPVSVPWSTGFENEFCDYSGPAGYCYAKELASYETVTTPVHSGEYAAAFKLTAGVAFDGLQTRCVRQGKLPATAFYSAYFFIPSAPSAANNWNLMHFRGGEALPRHGLWDVSLARQPDGSFRVYVFDFLRSMRRPTSGVPEVPIGSWFQLEVYLRRAADGTGAFSVYQDGELALAVENVISDDSIYGQWYLGNLAVSLTPPESVLYIDDVSIREAP